MINVSVFSDQVFVRLGLQKVIEDSQDFGPGASAGLSEEIGSVTGVTADDIFVLDLCGADKARKVGEVRGKFSQARIIAICPVTPTEFSIEALDAGAAGILAQNCAEKDLLMALRRVVAGDNYIQPDIGMDIVRDIRARERRRREVEKLRLSHRETQIVNHLMQGMTNRQIGAQLSISEKTVKHYVGILKGKFCAANRLEIVLQAQRYLS